MLGWFTVIEAIELDGIMYYLNTYKLQIISGRRINAGNHQPATADKQLVASPPGQALLSFPCYTFLSWQ